MTFSNVQPMCFGKFFGHFQPYWNYCSHRGITLSDLDVFVKTSFISTILCKEWEKNNWSIDQLEWICRQILFQKTMVDPVFFINDKFAYLNHVKNCFYMADIF